MERRSSVFVIKEGGGTPPPSEDGVTREPLGSYLGAFLKALSQTPLTTHSIQIVTLGSCIPLTGLY